MADEKEKLRIGVHAEMDGDGFDKAKKGLASVGRELTDEEKKAEALRAKFKQLTEQIHELGEEGAYVTPKKMTRLKLELDAVADEAARTKVEIGGIGDASEALVRAGKNATKLRVEMEDMGEEIQRATERAKGVSDLWDEGTSMAERYTRGVLKLTATFSGGFATGLMIAKRAGVDLRLTMVALNDTLDLSAKVLNYVIAGWLIDLGKLNKVTEKNIASISEYGARQVSLAEAAKKLGISYKWNQEQVRAYQEQLQKAENAEAKRLIDRQATLLKERSATEMQIATIERRLAVEGRSVALVKELTIAQLKLAETDKATAAEKIKIQTSMQVSLMEMSKERIAAAKEEAANAKEILDQERKEFEEWLVWRSAFFSKSIAQIIDKNKPTTKEESFFGSGNYAMTVEADLQAESEALNRRMEIEKGANKLTIDAYREMRLRQIRIAELLSDGEIDAAQKSADARILLEQSVTEMKKREEMTKWEAASSATGAIVGAAQGVWKDNKELAMAGAGVNAAQGITAIWSQWAAYPIVAAILTALEVAATYKQIQAINTEEPALGNSKTPPPSFDNPANDLLARRAGQRSAVDLVNHVNQGFVDALASGAAQRMGGATTDPTIQTQAAAGGGGRSGGGTVINIHGSGPADETVRRMRRSLYQWDQKVEVSVRGNRSKRVK